MFHNAYLSRTTAAILIAAVTAASYAAEPEPLFADHSLMTVTISAPFEQLMSDRPDEEYADGVLNFIGDDGINRAFDIGLRTRGVFRRQRDICPFAPLRVNFKKKQVAGTIFAKQDKLKAVTHCRNGSARYDQTVVSEYLAYRILNIMTDTSFRVRLLRVNYVYTDDDKVLDQYAFLIEHKDSLAERLQLPEKELAEVGLRQLQPEYTNLVSVFEYLIGNTDFSPVAGPPGDMCCHNSTLFGGAEPPFWAVPYDFDTAGIVNAAHARPGVDLNIKSVRQRLYRGRCINQLILPDTLEQFRAKREEIESLISNEAALEEGTRRSMLSYVEDFYETINNEKRVESRLTKECI